MAKLTYDNKIQMNENADIPAVNKGRAVDWNEIKTVVNTNDDNVGDLSDLNTTDKTSVVSAINEITTNFQTKGTILWTNPNPTSSFAAQNVNLLYSDWDSYEVIYGANTSSTSLLMSSNSIKGRGCKLNSKVDSNDICDREIQYRSQKLLSINNAYVNNAARNEYLIPLYIIGYKTGLFN